MIFVSWQQHRKPSTKWFRDAFARVACVPESETQQLSKASIDEDAEIQHSCKLALQPPISFDNPDEKSRNHQERDGNGSVREQYTICLLF